MVIPPFGGTGAARPHQFQVGTVTYTMYGYVASFDCKRPNDFANGNDALSYNRGTACHELCHTLLRVECGPPDVMHGEQQAIGASTCSPPRSTWCR